MAQAGRFEMVSKVEGSYSLQGGDDKLEGTYSFDRSIGKVHDRGTGEVIGTFSCDFISDQHLPNTLGSATGSRKLPLIRIEESDIMVEIQKSSNHGAFFVLPSQLNGAEYPSHNYIIDTVEKYKSDNTGGPRGQLAVHPGAAQFMLDNAASSNLLHGINAADMILERLRHAGFLFDIRNGYLEIPRISTEVQRTRSLQTLKQNMHRLRLLLMKDVRACGLTPDKHALAAAEHRVNLIYAAAVPVEAYMNYSGNAEQKQFQEKVADLFLLAHYYGALKMAAKHAEERGNRCVIFLMPLGGEGVLNSPLDSIATQMSLATEMLSIEELALLDVRALTEPEMTADFSRLLRERGTLREADLPMMFSMSPPLSPVRELKEEIDEDRASWFSFDECGTDEAVPGQRELISHILYSGDSEEEFDDARSTDWWDESPTQEPGAEHIEIGTPKNQVLAAASDDPLVGIAVKVKGTGREGVISVHHPDDELAYKVQFTDGGSPTEDWFMKHSVEAEARDYVVTYDHLSIVQKMQSFGGLRGLSVRRSKQLDDFGESSIPWGTVVPNATDELDGWLRIGDDQYLPMVLGDSPVLFPAQDGSAAASSAPVSSMSFSAVSYDKLTSHLEDGLSELWILTRNKDHLGTARVQDPEGESGTYTGPLLDGKPHGIGKVAYDADVKTGDLFLGEFSHGKMLQGICYHGDSARFTMRDGFWTHDRREWKVDPEILRLAPAFERALVESDRKSKEPPPPSCEHYLRQKLEGLESSEKCGGHCIHCHHCLHKVFECCASVKNHIGACLCQDGHCVSCEAHVRHSLASLRPQCEQHQHCHGCGLHCFHGLQKVCEKIISFKRHLFCQDQTCDVHCNHVCDGLVTLTDRLCSRQEPAARPPVNGNLHADEEVSEEASQNLDSSEVRERVLQEGDPVLCKDDMNSDWLQGVVVEAVPGEPVKILPRSWKKSHFFQHVCLDAETFVAQAAEAAKESAIVAARERQERQIEENGSTDDLMSKFSDFLRDLDVEVDILHYKLNNMQKVSQDYSQYDFTDFDGDQGVYRGKLHNGLAHGIGKVDYHAGASADYFIGEFKHGKMYEGVCYKGSEAVYTMTWGHWTHREGQWAVSDDIVAKVPEYEATMEKEERRAARSKALAVDVADELDTFERRLLLAAKRPQKGVIELATRKFNRHGSQAALSHVVDHAKKRYEEDVQPEVTTTCQCFLCIALLLNPHPRKGKEPKVKRTYFVDNSQLKLPTRGISYRISMSHEDKHPSELVSWGTHVNGVAENENWIRVGNLFLPVFVQGAPQGVRALVQLEEDSAPTAANAVKDESEAETTLEEHRYLVDNSELHATSIGLAFRRVKHMGVKADRVTKWGSYVNGFQEDDQWIRVGTYFLPMFVHGVSVLTRCNCHLESQVSSSAETGASPAHTYLIDNSHLHATTRGLSYRTAKGIGDMTETIAGWGSCIEGVEDGEWVKAEHGFLPIFVSGIRVLTKHDDDSAILAELAGHVQSRGTST